MTEVECPVGECEKQDSVRSMKAHVTASTDDDHKGIHGMDVADSLREQAESRLNGELPRLDEVADKARNTVADAGDAVLSEPGSEPADEPAEPEVEPVAEIDTEATDGGGEFGIPVPIDSDYIVIGVALLVGAIYLRSSSRSSGSSGPGDDDNTAASESDVVATSGLVS
jgi:hypothetical protein